MLDKVKDKLKKLFAVAENDASADGEIANAMRAAAALMAAHQISREDITDNDDGSVNVTFAKYSRYSRYTVITMWELILCRFISEFVHGSGFYIERNVMRTNKYGMATNKRATKITFYGASTDAEFCCDVFDEVVYVIEAAAQLRYGSALSRGEAAVYAEGFAEGLHQANKVEVAQLQKTSDSTALMVVNRALAVKQAGRDWVQKEIGLKLVKSKGVKSLAFKSKEAYAQGKADGAAYQPQPVGQKRLPA